LKIIDEKKENNKMELGRQMDEKKCEERAVMRAELIMRRYVTEEENKSAE